MPTPQPHGKKILKQNLHWAADTTTGSGPHATVLWLIIGTKMLWKISIRKRRQHWISCRKMILTVDG